MRVWWVVLVPVAVFVAAGAAAIAGVPFKDALTAVFLLLAPGAAVVWLTGVRGVGAWLALTVPTSLAIDALVVTGLTYLGIWSVEVALGIITALTVAAVALVPFERGARVALIAVALLPALVLVAAELGAAGTTAAVRLGGPATDV